VPIIWTISRAEGGMTSPEASRLKQSALSALHEHRSVYLRREAADALLKMIEERDRYAEALRFYARPETYTSPELAGDLTYVARVALGDAA